MFRVIDVFILKSIKGLINLCIIGVNYSCDREALYSHGRRRWETSSVGLNGRGNMTSVSLSLSLSLHPNTTFVDVILFISGRHRCVFVFLFGYFSWLRWICLVIAYWYNHTSDIGLYIYVYHSALWMLSLDMLGLLPMYVCSLFSVVLMDVCRIIYPYSYHFPTVISLGLDFYETLFVLVFWFYWVVLCMACFWEGLYLTLP